MPMTFQTFIYHLCILLVNQKLNADVTRGFIVYLTVTILLLLERAMPLIMSSAIGTS